MREGREDRGGRPEQREELGGGSADKVGWVAGQHKPESPGRYGEQGSVGWSRRQTQGGARGRGGALATSAADGDPGEACSSLS